MKLTITLTPAEEANIRATQDYLRANPQYIGVTKPPEGYGWNPADPRFQPRYILEAQTPERFAEIDAQMATPVDTLPRGTTNFPASESRIVAIPFTGPGRVSVSVADGKQVFLGATPVPGELQTYGNGAALVEVGPGEFYANVKLGNGFGSAPANLWIGKV